MFPVTGWFITEGKKEEEKEDNKDDNNKSESDIDIEKLFKQMTDKRFQMIQAIAQVVIEKKEKFNYIII